MKLPLLIALSAAGRCCWAQVSIAPEDIAVMIDGKPFTTFHYGSNANKPFLAPLRSASGKIITRHFPMEESPAKVMITCITAACGSPTTM